jgi:release factor glutamine methyltransferase
MQHPPQWNILSLLKWTTEYFTSRSIESPRASAEILLAHILNLKRIDLYIRYDQPMTADELACFKALIKRRAAGEPVAYIVGEKEFWSLSFCVTPDVLIPRPETEILVETTLSIIPKEPCQKIAELGTGSGAIIISLASERPGHDFFASDYSTRALNIAIKNANTHGSDIRFFAGDWFSALHPNARFNLIVSNPPYIPTSDIDMLQPEIRKFEPKLALDGGNDGLDAIRHILDTAKPHLVPGGSLMLEIGYDQKDRIFAIAEQFGYEELRCIRDYAGLDRVVWLKRS